MDTFALLRLPLALAVVIGLIFLVGFLLRRFGPWGIGDGRKKKRLALLDSQMVDNKRRLVLVRRDGVEHLLLIGGSNDLVVESGIIPPVAKQPQRDKKPQPAAKAPEPALSASDPLIADPFAADDDLYEDEAFDVPSPPSRREPSMSGSPAVPRSSRSPLGSR